MIELLAWGFLLFLAAPFLLKVLKWFFTSEGETPTKGRRRRRGATVPRGDVLKVIREAGGKGIGRAAIIEALGVKGDKTAENSVLLPAAGNSRSDGAFVTKGRRYFPR